MKRYLFLIVALLFMTVGALFAQDVEPPTDIMQWFGSLPTYLGSWQGVAVSFPFLTAFILGFLNLNEVKKAVKYLVTGGVGVILLLLAKFLSFGYLHEALWWWIPINFVGLMLTEIMAYAVIGNLLDAIAAKVNPWKPKE